MSVENARVGSGKTVVGVNYGLFALGFFLPITAVIGVIIAYVFKGDADPISASHYGFQIKMFWRGVILLAAALVLYLVTLIIGAVTGGIGMILVVLPIGVSIYWLVWTIIQIVRGVKAVLADQAVI